MSGQRNIRLLLADVDGTLVTDAGSLYPRRRLRVL
jgi:3-deoxy-D-manno-octulosonate 8-phosphate phosphatase KdsC-like HAD superfamily phosphatase